MPQDAPQPDSAGAAAFSELPGWAQDDHSAALSAFLRFCGETPGSTAEQQGDLRFICHQAASADNARTFLENHFSTRRIDADGFVTGYFEPEVQASHVGTEDFPVPLHRKPDGLVPLTDGTRPTDWPDTLTHGRKVGQALEQMPDRGEIMDGALDRESLELVWLKDPVDAFFIHVQGSARLKLTDGTTMRIGYAGKTGHPYTGIGRLLVTRGEGTPEDFTMDGLRAWLRADPERRDAILRENRSYIFFREVTEVSPDDGPIGAAGLPLVAGRSLAVDNRFLPYGSLVFVTADFPDPDAPHRPFARLLIADDTGSAIRGPARGDLFIGSGDDAGRIAGNIRHRATFTVLTPAPGPAN